MSDQQRRARWILHDEMTLHIARHDNVACVLAGVKRCLVIRGEKVQRRQ